MGLTRGLVLFAATAPAQEKDDDADLAKTIQNPLASLVSLPMQANYNLGVGEYDRTFFNLNIQPVIPYHPSENWNLITRTIVPVNSVPMFGKGWAIGTAPIVTSNWKSESGNRWVIPWGLQISKVSHFGRTPANILIGYYVNSEHPEGGADKQVRFQVNLLYPQ